MNSQVYKNVVSGLDISKLKEQQASFDGPLTMQQKVNLGTLENEIFSRYSESTEIPDGMSARDSTQHFIDWQQEQGIEPTTKSLKALETYTNIENNPSPDVAVANSAPVETPVKAPVSELTYEEILEFAEHTVADSQEYSQRLLDDGYTHDSSEVQSAQFFLEQAQRQLAKVLAEAPVSAEVKAEAAAAPAEPAATSTDSLQYTINGQSVTFTDPDEIKAMQEAHAQEQAMDPFQLMDLASSGQSPMTLAANQILENRTESPAPAANVEPTAPATAAADVAVTPVAVTPVAPPAADAVEPIALEQEQPVVETQSSGPVVVDGKEYYTGLIEEPGFDVNSLELVDPVIPSVVVATVGEGQEVMSKQDYTVQLQEALVEAGYDVGTYPDGHAKAGEPMIDGFEGPLTRAGLNEFAQDIGRDPKTMSLAETIERLQEQAEIKQAAENNFAGQDATFVGDIALAQSLESMQPMLSNLMPQPDVQPSNQPTVQVPLMPNQ